MYLISKPLKRHATQRISIFLQFRKPDGSFRKFHERIKNSSFLVNSCVQKMNDNIKTTEGGLNVFCYVKANKKIAN